MSQSHRLEYCIIPRLKWKIVPPPKVIPPKPTRIIRFANYRQRVGLYPRSGIMIAVPAVGSVIGGIFVYEFFVKESRERMRHYFFEVAGTDEPDSEFLRLWSDNQVDFPEDKASYEEMAQWNMYKLYPEPPLVPYDVPGWDKEKLKGGKDLKTLMKENVSPVVLNFGWPH